MAFNVEAVGKDEAPVIDVTRAMFTTEGAREFSAAAACRSRAFDASRSFVERARCRSPRTSRWKRRTPISTRRGPAVGSGPNPNAATRPPGQRQRGDALQHGEAAREADDAALFDERVGYFTVQQYDYGRDEHRARAPLHRPLAPREEGSGGGTLEPVKPIVYYIDPATPAEVGAVHQAGIESWQPAFEEAGFKNAILARTRRRRSRTPTGVPRMRATRDPMAARRRPRTRQGPHVSDPRTGEILESDIQFHHNVMNLVRDWYFVQVGPLDPRAARSCRCPTT
jgi:hypothetical protein